MRDARLRTTDHIVLGRERLRLVVVKDKTSAPGVAGKRALPKEFCAMPIDEEGDYSIAEGTTAEVPVVAGNRKRKKVRAHKKLAWMGLLRRAQVLAGGNIQLRLTSTSTNTRLVGGTPLAPKKASW
jgi:hypothetical protein